MKRMQPLMLGLTVLMLTAACDSRTASTRTQQHAAIEWDIVTAADYVARTPRNQSLIFMR